MTESERKMFEGGFQISSLLCQLMAWNHEPMLRMRDALTWGADTEKKDQFEIFSGKGDDSTVWFEIRGVDDLEPATQMLYQRIKEAKYAANNQSEGQGKRQSKINHIGSRGLHPGATTG